MVGRKEASFEEMASTTQLGISQTSRPKVNVKVKCHDRDLGHFTHVPRVVHLRVITHAQCYNFLSIRFTMQY